MTSTALLPKALSASPINFMLDSLSSNKQSFSSTITKPTPTEFKTPDRSLAELLLAGSGC